ncbi:MAG: glycosyltransferase family 4 protein [Tractidigestivibacter sp.]|jgi:glycosyltransferase involved in cell wall biosynthesis|uniref:glycosyltransferase family 4 protein n=1 Tax=Tractidigestivibacter sp. TaxID=2847320 RepID=UPI003D8A8C82
MNQQLSEGTAYPKKVVFVADSPIEGGATSSLVEVMTALKKLYGTECIALTPKKSSLNDRLAKLGIHSVVTGHGDFLIPQSSYLLKTTYDTFSQSLEWRKNLTKSVEIAERNVDFSTVDLIHTNVPRNDLGILLSARNRIPHICHLRENSFEDFKCYSTRSNPATFISDGSTAMIAVSKSVKANWAKRGADAKKIKVIYNGVDTSNIEVKSEEDRNADKKILRCIFLGGYGDAKGVRDLLEALDSLPAKLRSHFLVDVYGNGFPLRAQLFVKKHGLENMVRLHGISNTVPQDLHKYDIGVACSRAEAFGRVILQYRAAGLATIAKNSGSFPELLKHEETGLLYTNPCGKDSLAECLVRVFQDKSLRIRLSKPASSVRTPEDVANEIMNLYTDVLTNTNFA